MTINRINRRAVLSVLAVKKRSESMTPSGCDCERISHGSMFPEATVTTVSNLELHILYTVPEKKNIQLGRINSPRVRTLDSLL